MEVLQLDDPLEAGPQVTVLFEHLDALSRIACSIRTISRRAALSGSGAAAGPDAVDVLVQFSSIVRARSRLPRVRTTATTSTERHCSLRAFHRPQCAAAQERSALALWYPGSTKTKTSGGGWPKEWKDVVARRGGSSSQQCNLEFVSCTGQVVSLLLDQRRRGRSNRGNKSSKVKQDCTICHSCR